MDVFNVKFLIMVNLLAKKIIIIMVNETIGLIDWILA